MYVLHIFLIFHTCPLEGYKHIFLLLLGQIVWITSNHQLSTGNVCLNLQTQHKILFQLICKNTFLFSEEIKMEASTSLHKRVDSLGKCALPLTSKDWGGLDEALRTTEKLP